MNIQEKVISYISLFLGIYFGVWISVKFDLFILGFLAIPALLVIQITLSAIVRTYNKITGKYY